MLSCVTVNQPHLNLMSGNEYLFAAVCRRYSDNRVMRCYLVSHVKLAVLASSNSGNEQARYRETGWLVWKVTFLCQEAKRHRVKEWNVQIENPKIFQPAWRRERRRLYPCFDGHHGELYANGRQ